MADPVRRRVVVRGRVQGVGFRMAAAAEADRLEVAGSARNLLDGSVHVEAEGDPAAVDELVAWLRHGPPTARVESIEVESAEPTGATGFRVA